jgi:hypothetical protein
METKVFQDLTGKNFGSSPIGFDWCIYCPPKTNCIGHLGSKINVCCPLNSKPLYPDFPWVLNILQGVSIGVLYNGKRTEFSLPNKKVALIYTTDTPKAIGFSCYNINSATGVITKQQIISFCKKYNIEYVAYLGRTEECRYKAFNSEGLKVTQGKIEKISTIPEQPPCCFCETIPPIR